MARIIHGIERRPSGRWRVRYSVSDGPYPRDRYYMYVDATDELDAYKEAMETFRRIDNKEKSNGR